MAELNGTNYDMFDDVVLIEQKLYKDGYNEGHNKGQLIGEVEGFAMGVERGKAFGQEVGFYDGFVSTLLLLYENQRKPRLMKVLKQMHDKIMKINQRSIDPQDQEIFDYLEDIRSRFKQVTVMMDAKPLYGKESDDSSGISF